MLMVGRLKFLSPLKHFRRFIAAKNNNEKKDENHKMAPYSLSGVIQRGYLDPFFQLKSSRVHAKTFSLAANFLGGCLMLQ